MRIDGLINNVISNAFRHTPAGGTVTIEVTKSELMVGNSGAPLEHPEKIFHRFHRESRSTPGSGLGLSINNTLSTLRCFLTGDIMNNYNKHDLVMLHSGSNQMITIWVNNDSGHYSVLYPPLFLRQIKL